MIQQTRMISRATYAQMMLYFANWMTGIYINGYVPTTLLNNPASLLTNAAVLVHVCAAVLTFGVGIVLFTLVWMHGRKGPALCALLALVAIAVAETSGLSFALGIGVGDLDSMSMAVGFMTAVFLTFFSSMGLSSDLSGEGSERSAAKPLLSIIYSELALFYLVFLSGMYANIWVAGEVFAMPPALAREMLGEIAYSPPIVAHAALGTLLLGAGVASTVSLWFRGLKRLLLPSAISTSLIGYSTAVGVFNITGMMGMGVPLPGAQGSYLVLLVTSILSAAGFMASLLVSMYLATRIRSGRRLQL